MLPRGQNRVGANRLGARGGSRKEENKRRRKRERGRNRIVLDGVRILKRMRVCINTSMKARLATTPFRFRVSAGVARFYLLHSSDRRRNLTELLGQTKIQRATRRERMRILGMITSHGRLSTRPKEISRRNQPTLPSCVGDLTA